MRVRSRDTHYKYRPDSDFYYLTGFNEPEAALLLVPGHKEHQAIVFVPPKDPHKETWEGRRLGVEAAPATLGVDVAYSIDELQALLPKYLTGVPSLYFGMGTYPEFDKLVSELLPHLGNRHVQPPQRIVHPGTILHEMRLHKDEAERALMRKAAAITVEGYRAAVAAIRPGATEYAIEAALEGTYRRLGADGPAYNSIVATGENATILHYTNNCDVLKDGELLLIDSGAEYGWYACDVTRTYPVNGRFTPAQKAVYELVLKAEKEGIERVRVGEHVKGYHEHAVRVLTAGMVELGLLKGNVDELIQTEAFRKFYMHGTGHYLGLDTHDVGAYKHGEHWRPFEVGMVVTVEPGLYIPTGTPDIDPAFWGIGIRIEDDVLVTETGNEVLTSAIPKEVADIEAALRAPAAAHS
jgi:Xaa-Pro aminopeptidase